ncbi:hypothetical protein BCIN_04g03350 [Botrytis cinerea B05.10]|uniref:Uncharacterized protein n=1 Tax=Botryotinia fuckeliana (strain B05.10) TaxID=332648 RepID=A0A384JFB0_BOTFB|nr:hypothetical protein BCIN_04g03350 [Botrytis cinerea B05.10]ATZ49151.1 hypothetical protein BCIN_04g03350 [Botrytis cinerea B05.10]
MDAASIPGASHRSHEYVDQERRVSSGRFRQLNVRIDGNISDEAFSMQGLSWVAMNKTSRDRYLRISNLLTPAISESQNKLAILVSAMELLVEVLDGSLLCAIENLNLKAVGISWTLRVVLMAGIISYFCWFQCFGVHGYDTSMYGSVWGVIRRRDIV